MDWGALQHAGRPIGHQNEHAELCGRKVDLAFRRRRDEWVDLGAVASDQVRAGNEGPRAMGFGNRGERSIGGICDGESVGHAGEQEVPVREERPLTPEIKRHVKYIDVSITGHGAGDPYTPPVPAAVLEMGRRASLSENMRSLARFLCEVPQLEYQGRRNSQGCDRTVTAEVMNQVQVPR